MLRLNTEDTHGLPRAAHGFTLIELLVVIVLMGVIIGISAPAFVGMGRGAGMRGAVRGVCSTLSLLRQWAITHREQVTFRAATGTAASYYFASNSAGIILSNELPLEVIFDQSYVPNKSITFKADGGLAGVGAIPADINIRDRKFPTEAAKGKTISINGLTGGIKVE